MREGDLVARISGDEFLVVLTGVQALVDALEVGESIREVLAAPLELTGGQGGGSASIGIAMANEGDSVDALVRRADAAMYRAKRSGGNRVDAADQG